MARSLGSRITLKGLMVAVAACAVGMALAPPPPERPILAALIPLSILFAIGLSMALPDEFSRDWDADVRSVLMTFVLPVALVVPAALLLAVLALLEVFLCEPMPAWIYLPTAIAIGGGLWPRGAGRLRRRRMVAAGVVCGSILALYLVPWTTRKPFLRALATIKPGMTTAKAWDRMAGYMEGPKHAVPGSAQPFIQSGTLLFRHSNQIYMNADFGAVTIRDGRVVDVRFDPD